MSPPLAVLVGAAAALRLLAPAAALPPASAATSAVPGEPTSSQPPPRVAATATAIEVAVVGSAADLARVRTLVRPRAAGAAGIRWRRLEAFSPAEILRAAPDGDPRAQTVRCWIDLGDRRRAHLYFAGRSGTRFLIRDVPLSGKFDELDLTSLAEVIDASLAAVIDDKLAAMSRLEAERVLAAAAPAPAPAPAPTSRAAPAPVLASTPPPVVVPPGNSWGPGIGIFYAAQAFAAELPLVSGPGLAVTVPFAVPSAVPSASAGQRWQVGAWLSAQYQIPASARGDLASVRLSAITTRAGLLGVWHLGDARRSRWGIEVRIGSGADSIHLTPEPGTQDPTATLTRARWATSLAFTTSAGVAAALGQRGRTRLGARLYADLLPIAAHYDVAVDGQPMTVVAPGRLRPGLVAELTVVLGGGARSE